MIESKEERRMEKMGRNMDGLYSWRKENIKRVSIDLNKINHADVIEQLDKQPSKQAYIVELIRKDMEERK